MNANEYYKQIQASPCATYWLKDAVKVASTRDPVDALRDAEALVQYCQKRLNPLRYINKGSK